MRDSRADMEIREEVDLVNVDPRFVERQRNRYASRGVALVVLLNGVAANRPSHGAFATSYAN
jgi:hypothetical protein